MRTYIVMFIVVGIVLILINSCKKDSINPVVGQLYHIKGNIFNKGAYQPAQPVLDMRNYIDAAYNMPYSEIKDMNGLVWYIPQEDLL